MKTNKTYTVAKRRKREGKTDYKRRLKLLLARKPRLVVRKSSKNITAQIVEYGENGDNVIASANSSDIKKLGWKYNTKNTPCAYLVGALIAKKAKDKGINEAILDIGLQFSVTGSKIYAVLKGAVDNGLDVPHSNEVLPKADRISGKHIQDYANSLKDKPQIFNKKFSECVKNNADPTQITKAFNDMKNKIIGA
jgi:large subunit ribosomal protein L18